MENQETIEWFVIVNPNAGKRKGAKDWLKIAALLNEAGIRFTNVFTEHKDHASKLAKKYIENGHKKIIVVGGDGTLNEVVNGVFNQSHCPTTDITLAMIPVGTGNDWCRMFKIPGDYKQAINLIIKGKTFIQDAGSLTYYTSENQHPVRYFINMAGLGFDAMVAKKTNKQKEAGKSNPLSYFYNIFTSLFSYQNTSATITFDNETFKSDVFTMSVGIGMYNGGGMKQAPNASPDDGLFDISIIRPIGKFKVIRNVLKLFDGSYVKLPEVSSFQSSSILIETRSPLYIEADGESLGHSPFEFKIVSKSIKLISGI